MKPRAVGRRRGRCLHVRGVGAGVRLGQRERAQLASADQIGQPLRLLFFGAEQEQRPDADRMVGVDEDRGRAASRADHFEQAAVAHLREAAAAEFGRRRHAEDAEFRQAVDDVARDIGLAIDALGVEMFVAEVFEVGDRLFDFGSLRSGQLRIRKNPIGDEMAFEQSLGHAGFLRHRPQQFLGLLHLRLALGEAIGWLGGGCSFRLASSGNGISRSIWPNAFPWASVRSVRRRAPRITKFNAPRLGNSNRSTDSMPMGAKYVATASAVSHVL